jgi:hypothetical protein
MAMTTAFYLAFRSDERSPGGGPPRAHALLPGATTAVCGLSAPMGWALGKLLPPSLSTDWNLVTCPNCRAAQTKPKA